MVCTSLASAARRRLGEFSSRVLNPVTRHDAFLGLVLRLPVGIRDMEGQPQIDLALAGVARLAVRLSVGGEVRRQPRKRAAAHRNKDRVSRLAQRRKSLLAGGGDAD